MIDRFTSFDKLIGPSLIKVFYWVGMIVIVGATLIAAVGSLFQLGSNAGAALGGFIVAPIFGLLGLIFWRFMCEIYLLFFRMSDDLRDIKNHQLGRPANETDINVG